MTIRTLHRAALVAMTLLVTVCGVIPAAWAHDYLVSSNPAANGTVASAPKQVTLTFDDLVLDRPARPQVTVQGPDGRYYETGCSPVTDRVVTTPVALGPAGKYTVTWRIVSADGHPVSDRISFTYAGGAAGGLGRTTPRACTEPGANSQQSQGNSVPTAAVFAVAGIALVGVAGVTYLLLTRGRSRGREDAVDADDDADDDRE